MITEFLSREGYKSSDFDCVVSRGGPLKAVSSGAYSINEQMLKDAAEARTPDPGNPSGLFHDASVGEAMPDL